MNWTCHRAVPASKKAVATAVTTACATAQLGNNGNFQRLRIGIGHPGSAAQVTNYVLGKPSVEDRISIEACISEALRCLPDAVQGNWGKAMNALHSYKQG